MPPPMKTMLRPFQEAQSNEFAERAAPADGLTRQQVSEVVGDLADRAEAALEVLGARGRVGDREHGLAGAERGVMTELAGLPARQRLPVFRDEVQRADVGCLVVGRLDAHQAREELVDRCAVAALHAFVGAPVAGARLLSCMGGLLGHDGVGRPRGCRGRPGKDSRIGRSPRTIGLPP